MNEKLNDDSNENLELDPKDAVSGSGDSDELEFDKEHFDEIVREKEQFRSIAQRAQADLVNYRNRATQELEEARRTVKFGLLTRFLAIADDLSRAVDSVPDDADQNWSAGILLVLRNLENIFEMEGVKKINALGTQFDPYLHEALLYEENEDANKFFESPSLKEVDKDIKDNYGSQSLFCDDKYTNRSSDSADGQYNDTYKYRYIFAFLQSSSDYTNITIQLLLSATQQPHATLQFSLIAFNVHSS